MPSKRTGIVSSTTAICEGARPVQMNTLTPRSCSRCSASTVESGTICVTKLVSVPSMSKNAAWMSGASIGPAVVMGVSVP